MSLINISHLTFAYDGTYQNIFEDVSFQIDTSWKLGFTGRNGRGKTTFFKLLLNELEYQGSISASVNFEYFPFIVEDTSKNGIEVIDSILSNYQYWELLKELSLLDTDDSILYRPFNTLSGGEQTKLMLAILFLKPDSFLLIDEPTNHLDTNARNIIAKYLNTKSGFILISHDRNLLDTCTDHTLSINKTNIEVQKGSFSSWWENKQRQDSFELSQNERLNSEIDRLTQSIKKTTQKSNNLESKKIGFNPNKIEKSAGRRPMIGKKAEKVMKRSKSMLNRQQSAIDEKSKLLKNIETMEDLKLSPLKHYSNTLISVKDLTIYYDSIQVCNKVSFEVNQGDRVFLNGKNGCGKSSILKLLCGEDIEHTGDIFIANNLKISYIYQSSLNFDGTLTQFSKINNLDEPLFKAILRKLDFSREQFEKNINRYSEGQKKKVLIAKSLCEKAHIYIWDEPLNYIDIISRLQLEELIKKFNPTMLVVEHDISFMENINTKIIYF